MFEGKSISVYSLLITTVLALVASSLGSFGGLKDPTGLFSRTLDASSKILFGHIWRYGEYCGDQRELSERIQQDYESEKFYNGTTLELLARKGDLQALDELIYKGIKARHYSNYVCASGSWGYADQGTFARSQSPRNNEFECKKSLDKLYDSYKSLITSPRILDMNADINQCQLDDRTTSCDHTISKSSNLLADDGDASSSSSSKNHFENWIILNTYGRPLPGPIYQTHQWPGDFATCTRSTKWRHCYGAVRSMNWPNDQMAFRIGMCLPSSCDERLMKSPHYLNKLDQLVKYNLINGSFGLLERYKLVDMYCPPALDSLHYQALGDSLISKLLALLALMWLIMIVYANVLTKLLGPSNNKLLQLIGLVFNLEFNWAQFRRTSGNDSRLAGLNAIKVLAMNWLVCTHVLMIMSSYIVNIQELRDVASKSLIFSAMSQGQHIVAGFFVMSGVLLGYKFFRNGSRPEGITMKNAIKMIYQRYFRLMPLYVVAYAYTKQFGHLIGNGPFWDAGVSAQSEVRQCRNESWLIPLLTLGNFVSPWGHCVLTGWHLANDFQIFLALPVLLVAYARSRFVGRLTALVIFALTQVHHFYLLQYSKLFVWETVASEPLVVGMRHMADRCMFAYLNPIGRMGTCFFGVFMADLIYLNSSNGSKKKEQQAGETVRVRHILVLGLLLMLVPLFGPVIMPMPARFMFGYYSKGLTYNIVRLMGEIGWSAIVYYLLVKNKRLLETREMERAQSDRLQSDVQVSKVEKQQSISDREKQNGISTGFLALPLWDILVKLNFCVMLIHFALLRLLIQTQTQLMTFSVINMIAYSSAAVVTSYIVSLFLHLLVEMPLASLVTKLLFH